MAFANFVATLIDDCTVIVTTDALAARVGAPAIAGADTGEMTSDTAVANQGELPARWGPGRDNWVQGDVNRVHFEVDDANAAAQGAAGETSLVHLVAGSPRLVAGNFVCTFHNRGAQVGGAMRFKLVYQQFQRLGPIARS